MITNETRTLVQEFENVYPGYSVYRTTREVNGQKYTDGLSIVANETETEYELLECKTLDNESPAYVRRTTSDIAVIFEVNDDGYKRLINFVFGATNTDTVVEYAIEMISDFRNGKTTDLQADMQ